MNHNRSEKFWNGSVAGSVVRGLAVAFVALAISGLASAQTDWFNTLQFEGGIGVILLPVLPQMALSIST